ncbi:MAG: YcxB family protein [Chitinophagaceae bacterium]
MLTLQFNYDKKEVIGALRYHFLNRGEIGVLRWTLLIFFLLTLIGNFFHLVQLPVVIAVLLMVCLLFLIFWYLLPFSIFNKSATFQESIHLSAKEDYLSIGTRFSERRVAWTSFIRVVQTRDFLFLYRDKKTFFLIPVNGWKDEQEFTDFYQLLRRKIKDYQIK